MHLTRFLRYKAMRYGVCARTRMVGLQSQWPSLCVAVDAEEAREIATQAAHYAACIGCSGCWEEFRAYALEFVKHVANPNSVYLDRKASLN
jgi:hypothetical protein